MHKTGWRGGRPFDCRETERQNAAASAGKNKLRSEKEKQMCPFLTAGKAGCGGDSDPLCRKTIFPVWPRYEKKKLNTFRSSEFCEESDKMFYLFLWTYLTDIYRRCPMTFGERCSFAARHGQKKKNPTESSYHRDCKSAEPCCKIEIKQM